jgi:hypothetical protein
MDIILYHLWLWVSKRWFAYRITGMDKDSHQTEIVIFASQNADIDKVMKICANSKNEVESKQ